MSAGGNRGRPDRHSGRSADDDYRVTLSEEFSILAVL
jgi:hypothetical protein